MPTFSDDGLADSKPISGLFSDALQQFSRLMRNEFALARAELVDKGKTAARGGAMIAGGGVLAVPGLALLLMALAAFMIELGMRASLACLLSGILGLVIAGLVAWSGVKQLQGNALVPRRTIGQLQQDAATAKELF
jgi:Putative Actinobacterial Holin-X, holin superfamily III